MICKFCTLHFIHVYSKYSAFILTGAVICGKELEKKGKQTVFTTSYSFLLLDLIANVVKASSLIAERKGGGEDSLSVCK